MTRILDLNFLDLPGAIAAFLVPSSEGPVLVETGPYSTFDTLKQAVEDQGASIDEIRHVLLTHIHLDHAGAAWAFAEAGAKIYVHPFGARHLISPEKLMESARRIYQDEMDRLWGDMKPIPEQQVVTVNHGDVLTIGDKQFTAHHTPGHARHHIAWQVEETLFTGDVAGVKIQAGPVVPPCPPPDIDLEAWKQSLDLIRGLDIQRMMLTHFGEITDATSHLQKLEDCLDDWAQWIRREWESGKTNDEMLPAFDHYTGNQLVLGGVDEQGKRLYEAANPSWMSVAGLVRYWTKNQT